MVRFILSKINEKYGDMVLLISRILVGMMFLLHGIQKFAGAQIPQTFSLFWWAGVIEIVVGSVLILGLFTRLSSLIGAIEVAVAYFKVHMPQGLSPLANGGELAVLYFAIFLLLLSIGAGKLSIDNLMTKNEQLKKIL